MPINHIGDVIRILGCLKMHFHPLIKAIAQGEGRNCVPAAKFALPVADNIFQRMHFASVLFDIWPIGGIKVMYTFT